MAFQYNEDPMNRWRGVIVMGVLASVAGGLIRLALGNTPEGGAIVTLSDDERAPSFMPETS